MKKHKKYVSELLSHQISGFSLTEISIGLIIMGLLIGGALKGKALIRSARLNAVVSQLRETEMSLSQYKETYGSFPGQNADGSFKEQKEIWEDLSNFLQQESPSEEMPKTKMVVAKPI